MSFQSFFSIPKDINILIQILHNGCYAGKMKIKPCKDQFSSDFRNHFCWSE